MMKVELIILWHIDCLWWKQLVIPVKNEAMMLWSKYQANKSYADLIDAVNEDNKSVG